MYRRSNHVSIESLEDRQLMSVVALFYNSSDVATKPNGAIPGAATNLLQELQGLGDTVKTFTGLDSTSITNALSGADALVIPDLSQGAPTLANSTQTLIRNFVTGGGGYISVGNAGNNNTNLMAEIFGYPTLPTSHEFFPSRLTNDVPIEAGATDTAYAGGPAFNVDSGGSYYINDLTSTVAGSKEIYGEIGSVEGEGYDATDVGLLPYASRLPVAFLGRDWSLGGPNGTEDGNWAEILRRTLLAVARPQAPTKITVTLPATTQTATAGVNKPFALGSFTQSGATGPFTIDVNWGDGTADSKFSASAAETIPATAHTFATAGSKTVSVTVTDSKSHTSNKPTFVVTVTPALTGSITGIVFIDSNVDGKLTTGEKDLAGVKVFLDTNKNGVLDTGEKTVSTNSAGVFTFTGLGAGAYRIAEVLPAGYAETAPTADYFNVTVVAGKVASGYLFADAPATASIGGTVFDDTNGNGKQDTGELGLGLWTVDLDYTTGIFKGKVVTETTAANGSFSFSDLTAGTYVVKIVAPYSGTKATTPAGGTLTLTLTAGEASKGHLFGES